METIIIRNISELLTELKKISLNEVLWFRGHANKSWKLIPSLGRMKKVDVVATEYGLLRRFKQNALYFTTKRPQSEWDWLFLMQHHGVPTRLLDWTENPLIALYFAVDEFTQSDGILWCLYPTRLNKISNIPVKYPWEIPCFDHDPELDNYKTTIIKMENKTSFYPIAAIAIRDNPRIYAQMGAFTITHREQFSLEDIKSNNSYIIKFLIPSKSKKNISKELSYLKINSLTIYPELDNVSKIAKEVLNG